MPVKNPPVFLQTKEHPAEDVRRWLQAVMFGSTGVFTTTDLAVTPGAGLTVSVAEGRAVIPGTQNTYQGAYFVEARGATTVTLTGANATNPRIDLIVGRVKDSLYGGSSAEDGWTLEVVTGTAAAAPVAPAAPANSIVLAQVRVNAGATSLTAGNITDQRVVARRPGTQIHASAAARSVAMPSPILGEISYLADVQRFDWWNGTAWSRFAFPTVSTADPSGGQDGDVWIKVV